MAASVSGADQAQLKKALVTAQINKVFGSVAGTALKIAKCESGLNPEAHNQNARTRDNSVGIFQINLYGDLAKHRPPVDWLKSPMNNIEYAYDLYKRSGNSFNAWSCYRKI